MRRVDRTHSGGYAIFAMGLSRLVEGKEFIFLTELDSFKPINPAETSLVQDTSAGYRASRLHIESLLRRTPPTDEHIYLGHRAAMDSVPYQLRPTCMALEQPRARILIADAVGLGKTLEAGILMSELIRRDRGKRILVVALKSMLTQIQKELWSRFSIPLLRLDSIGIQRVRSKIPSNHNPFYYYDRAIISIDTLKMAQEYRTYIEQAYWDIIVIDEAQNVADRGTRSLRSRLAKLLASRSDTLIMLSATPHDGRARSFASLVNMLDPTAIANQECYTKEELEGKNLFIRRFKKDIKNEVALSFLEREIELRHASASPEEEAAFECLVNTPSDVLSRRVGGAALFRTVLEKALFSSPTACRKTVGARIKRLEKRPETLPEDLDALRSIDAALERIGPKQFSKYQLLLKTISDIGWTGKDTQDRLVIFTERIDTLKFLSDRLDEDLNLREGAIAQLYGTLSDIQQQDIVDKFGREKSDVRLLIASDVASEGINLHFLCHRMIHFDIPWSLMVFQQRNGRIDRYGQEREPNIYYLVTKSENKKIRGDSRILELLIEKERQAEENIGDPASIIGVYDVEEEVRVVTEAMERNLNKEDAELHLASSRNNESEHVPFDPVAALMGDMMTISSAACATRTLPSLFPSDYNFLQAALLHLRQSSDNKMQVDFYDEEQRVLLTAPTDLKERLEFLPREARPDKDIFDLCAAPETVLKEIKRCRSEEKSWPRIQYLWPPHPVVSWAADKVATLFGRQEAPVVAMPDLLQPGEAVYVISVLFPNRKGHTVLQEWYAIRAVNGECEDVKSFASTAEYRALRSPLSNKGNSVEKEAAREFLPQAVDWADAFMDEEIIKFRSIHGPKLDKHLEDLRGLRARHEVQVNLRYQDSDPMAAGRKKSALRTVDKIFDDYQEWIRDTMELGDKPFIQVVVVLVHS